MTSMRYTFFSAVMVAFAMQTLSAATSGWLSPEATEANPYTFLDATGTTVTLPSALYSGWTVFNASSATVETAQQYDVSSAADADSVGDGMLRFKGQVADENAYLALGIRASATMDTPQTLEPVSGKVRVDNVYAKVRFVECAETPEVSELMEMYPSYADSLPTENGELPPFTAAKLGVCVGDDGYFRVTRVRSGTADNPGDGLPENYTYEFCKSKHSYAEVGGGAVIIRIEFNTYESVDYSYRRAFRIFAKNADGGEEICLTEDLGYPWLIQDGVYQFDFSALEEGEWLYAIDDAIASAGGVLPSGEARAMVDAPIDALNHLAFSASDGGFYSAWMSQATLDDVVTLSTYDTSLFTPFVSAPGAYFDLYAAWAADYNVTLSDWLKSSEGGLTPYAVDTAADELTQHAFDAFLLYMDPETDEALRLTVTGIVPEEDMVSFTVTGPDGCNLREAVSRASRLRIRRAADLASLATADATDYDIVFSSDGTVASFAVPKVEDDVELPFMQATLVPVTDCE